MDGGGSRRLCMGARASRALSLMHIDRHWLRKLMFFSFLYDLLRSIVDLAQRVVWSDTVLQRALDRRRRDAG